MKQNILLVLSIFLNVMGFSQAISQKNQAISYRSSLYNAGVLIRNAQVAIEVSILKNSATGTVIYKEQHISKTDTAGIYQIDIGRGRSMMGQFDSIIWSDGIYYLGTRIDPSGGMNYTISNNSLIRIAPELSNDYEQGTVTASDHPEWGEWRFPNTKNKRPKLVTVDLSTSYANLAYPANTYPIYRHYEWCDPERKGIGNAFTISFSENTSNDFREKTTKLGEVRLYSIPFQEINISSTNNEITVSITKPIPVSNLGETYAIKGPWKFIYYIEW